MTKTQPRRTIESLVANMDAAQARGEVRNTEFKDIKYYLNQNYEYTRDMVRDEYVNNMKWDSLPENMKHFHESDMIYVSKTLREVAKLTPQDHPYVRAMVAAYTPYVALVEKMNALKPLVVKGRAKLSADQRKTPERTLNNTGFCPVCSQNVKLNGGLIVMHGYQVNFHQFVGRCFGVGFRPFEVSAEGAEKFVEMLKRGIEKDRATKVAHAELTTITHMVSVRKPGEWRSLKEERTFVKGQDEDFAKYHAIQQANLDGDIRQGEMMVKVFTEKVAGWVVRPLPDGNRAHMGE